MRLLKKCFILILCMCFLSSANYGLALDSLAPKTEIKDIETLADFANALGELPETDGKARESLLSRIRFSLSFLMNKPGVAISYNDATNEIYMFKLGPDFMLEYDGKLVPHAKNLQEGYPLARYRMVSPRKHSLYSEDLPKVIDVYSIHGKIQASPNLVFESEARQGLAESVGFEKPDEGVEAIMADVDSDYLPLPIFSNEPLQIQQEFEAMPIFKKGLEYRDVKVIEELDRVSQVIFDESGKVVKLNDPRRIMDQSRQDMFRKIMRVFRQYNGRYRGLTPHVKVSVVENSNQLVRVARDREGNFEVIMDKTLLDTGKDIDLGPFFVLVFNHELNHALLSEERLGRPVNKVLGEATVNASDLITFWEMTNKHRVDVRNILKVLDGKGFNTGPYLRFLGYSPPIDMNEKRRYEDSRDVPAFFSKAFNIAVNPRVNPDNYRMLRRMSVPYVDSRGKQKKISFASAIRDSKYRNAGESIRLARNEGTLLYNLLETFEKVCSRPMKLYNQEIDKLFELFERDVYILEGRVNYDVDKQIIEKDLPRIVQVGGERAIERLKEVLGTTFYSIMLRIEAAKAIQKLAAPRRTVLKNPFVIRDILKLSQYWRSNDPQDVTSTKSVLGDIRMNDRIMIINMLGNAKIESPRLYNVVRSEIIEWYIQAQRIARKIKNKKDPTANDEKTYARARAVMDAAENMLEESRKNLREFLGIVPLMQDQRDSWKEKIKFVVVPDWSLDLSQNEEDELSEDSQIRLWRRQGIVRHEIYHIREILQDPDILIESIYLLTESRIKLEDIKSVKISFLGLGHSKAVYLIDVERKDGKSLKIARNIVMQDKTSAIDEEVKRSNIGFSKVKDEMYRLMRLDPGVFERAGGYKDFEMIPDADDEIYRYWDEEFKLGKVLYDQRNPDLPCYINPAINELENGEKKDEWRERMRRTLRNYVKACFQVWASDKEMGTGFDINVWNVIVDKDETISFIDAGIYYFGGKEISDYWKLVRRNVNYVIDKYPELKSSIAPAEYMSGVLDALGEQEGLKVLSSIRAEINAADRAGSYNAFKGDKDKGAMGEIDEYLNYMSSEYVPPQADEKLNKEEYEQLRKSLSESIRSYYFSRGLQHLEQSPWLWAYIYKRFFDIMVSEAPEVRGKGGNVIEALNALILKMKSDRDFFETGKRNDIDKWLEEEIIAKYELKGEFANYVRTAVNYEATLSLLVDKWLVSSLTNKRKNPDENIYRDARVKIIDFIGKVNSDPEGAAWDLQKMMMQHGPALLLYDIYQPAEGPAGREVGELFELFIRDLIKMHFMDRNSFIEVLKSLPPEKLGPFMRYGYYPELLHDLLLRDYKSVAIAYQGLINMDTKYSADPKHPVGQDRAAELAYLLIVSEKVGTLGLAYLLGEFDTKTQIKIFNSILGWKKVDGPWSNRWYAQQRMRTKGYLRGILPKTAVLFLKYYEIDPQRATKLLIRLLNGLVGGVKESMSFLNIYELSDRFKNRVEDMYNFLGRIPVDVWENALRSRDFKKSQVSKSLYIYMDTLNKIRSNIYEKSKKTGIKDDWAIWFNRMQVRRIIDAVDRLENIRPNIIDTVVYQWLMVPDLSGSILAEIIHKMPYDSLKNALIRMSENEDQDGFDDLILRALRLGNRDAKDKFLEILREAVPPERVEPEGISVPIPVENAA